GTIEQADGVLWDQSGKLSSKGARLLQGRQNSWGDRSACRIACARAADRVGNKPATDGDNLGSHLSTGAQIRTRQKPYQRCPPIRFWEGAGGTYHVLLRGYHR